MILSACVFHVFKLKKSVHLNMVKVFNLETEVTLFAHTKYRRLYV